MTRELLEEIEVGTRTITGTEWSVVDQLHRTGPREWTVTRELCNGVPRRAEVYDSEDEAREAFGERAQGRKPRAGAPANGRIAIRVTGTEHASWSSAASSAGMRLGEWVRAVAESAARAGDHKG